MAVITDIYSDFHSIKGNYKCADCGETLRRYPFLEWRCDVDFYLCADCCKRIKEGFIADLIHVVAIKDMQDLSAVYEGYTLVRKNIERLEAEEKSKWPPITNLKRK